MEQRRIWKEKLASVNTWRILWTRHRERVAGVKQLQQRETARDSHTEGDALFSGLDLEELYVLLHTCTVAGPSAFYGSSTALGFWLRIFICHSCYVHICFLGSWVLLQFYYSTEGYWGLSVLGSCTALLSLPSVFSCNGAACNVVLRNK